MKKVIHRYKSLERKDQIVFFLSFSTITTFFIAIVKFIFSLVIPSLWFFINAIFGFVLSICRFLTIKRYRVIRKIKNKEIKMQKECRNYLQNGILLIFLSVSYFSVSIYMYYKGANTNMHEYITYLIALIAFYSIGDAIYGMIKYKRNKEPIIKGIKITSFAKALTSIVLTQVVLLDTFGAEYNYNKINGYTGIIVSIIICILGLYMIISAKKDLSKYHRKKELMVKFKQPKLEDKQIILDYVQEHYDDSEFELHGSNMLDKVDFKEWIDKLENDKHIPDEFFGKSNTYLVLNENNKMIGMINIRITPTEDCIYMYGHIGYGVRPSERRKGYATEMLKLALKECKEANLKEVIISCDSENVASIKTILKNNGQLERELVGTNRTIQYYKIKL